MPTVKITPIADIAKVCHEINKLYCEMLEDRSQVPWEEAPEWQKESAINGVLYFLENPDASAGDLHENWRAEKVADGWVYGPVKDAVAKTHPCLVPFAELPLTQKMKDMFFLTVVRSMP